jgi:hypothetical protein
VFEIEFFRRQFRHRGIERQALVLGIAFAGRHSGTQAKIIEEISAPIFGAHSCLGL